MTDLIDRIAGNPYMGDRPKIKVHQFFADMRLYADGTLTIAQARLNHDLGGNADPAELTQADAIKTAIDGAGNTINTIALILRIEAVMLKLDGEIEGVSEYFTDNGDGTFSIDKARVISDAGF